MIFLFFIHDIQCILFLKKKNKVTLLSLANDISAAHTRVRSTIKKESTVS